MEKLSVGVIDISFNKMLAASGKRHCLRKVTMKTLLLITFIFISTHSISQDTSVTWIVNIDTSSFEIYYNKNNIPKEFYKFIGIDNKRNFAGPTDNWNPTCVGKKHHRLNWIARDKKNHWVISITYGGRGVWTNYYYFDKEVGKLNVNELIFGRINLSFGQTVTEIKSGNFKFAVIDLTDYEEDIN